jgi:peptidoglycan L-alanyl-D-glutamate endopeptidase CwlK
MNLVDQIKTIQRAVGAIPDGAFGPQTASLVVAALSRRGEVIEAPEPTDELDERSVTNIRTLDAKARERFYQLLRLGKATAATFGCDWVMISGHRTWEEQDALYARGRTAPGEKVTKAKGGQSNHNFAIAGDFGVFRGKSYLDDSNPELAEQVHTAIAVHARKLGFEWGGDWKSFKDIPHFEISTGLSMAEKRELWERKGSVL